MTDRREAVMRSIVAAEQAHYAIDALDDRPYQEIFQEILGDLQHDNLADSDYNAYWDMADAALSVIDTEPTEAEVVAAINAHTKELGLLHTPAVLSDGRAQMDAMRAALIAARKAGKE